jgi:hypothetical protein
MTPAEEIEYFDRRTEGTIKQYGLHLVTPPKSKLYSETRT